MNRFLSGFRHPTVLGATIVAVLVNCLTWWFVGDRTSASSESIPLHYNIYFGIDLIGPWWYAFFIPALGTAVLVVNAVLAGVLSQRERMAAYFFSFASVFTTLLLLLTSYFSLTQT